MARRIIDYFEDVITYDPEHPIDTITLYRDLICEKYGRVFIRNVDRKKTEEILEKVDVISMGTSNVYKRRDTKDVKGDASKTFKSACMEIGRMKSQTELDLGNVEIFDFVTILGKSKDKFGAYWWFFEIDQNPKPCGFGALPCEGYDFYELIGTMGNDGFNRSFAKKYPQDPSFHPFRGDYFGGKIKL